MNPLIIAALIALETVLLPGADDHYEQGLTAAAKGELRDGRARVCNRQAAESPIARYR